MVIRNFSKIILGFAVLVSFFLPNLVQAASQSEVYYQQGNAYADKGEYDLAITSYTKAIGVNPQYANAYCSRGLAYKLEARYDLAIIDYTEVIALNPNELEYYLKRADAYRPSRKDLAVDDCNHVLRIDPNNKAAYWAKYDMVKNRNPYDCCEINIRDTSYNPFRR